MDRPRHGRQRLVQQPEPARRVRLPTTTSGPIRSADRSRRTSSSSSPTTKVSATSFLRPSRCIAPSPTICSATLANLAADDPAAVALYHQAVQLSTSQRRVQRTNGIPAEAAAECGTWPGFHSGTIAFDQYQATPALPGTEWILSGRVDYNLSDKDHLFWRVRMDHGTQATLADPINAAFSAASYQPAYDGQGQWTHVFSPNATNQLHLRR